MRMKRIHLSILAGLLCLTALAQTEKGRLMTAGYLSYSGGKGNADNPTSVITNKSKGFGFFTSASLGRFLKDNMALGFSLGYGAGTTSNQSIRYDNFPTSIQERMSRGINETYLAALFARQYSKPILEKFRFYGNLALNYSWGYNWQNQSTRTIGNFIDEYSSTTSKQITQQINLQFSPGLAFMLNKHFILEAVFGGTSININTVSHEFNGMRMEKSTNSNFSSNLNLSLNNLQVGFTYIFGKPTENKTGK